MFCRSRFLLFVGGSGSNGSAVGGGSGTHDYRTSPKLTDAFHSILHRSQWAFDHVVVDIPSIINSVAFMSRDFVGHERDRETVRNVQRQLQAVILRRLQPRKSLALLFDGAEPLWQLERMRLFPGRRYDSKFYRSCASPMPYLLEEKLRGSAMEMRAPPTETVISGPATSGLSEGKISAYLLDLATRVLRPPTSPPHLCASISPNDTICVVGAPELAWTGLGVTPFHNITTVTLQQGELTCCSVQEMMRWLRQGHLMTESAPPGAGAADGDGAERRDGDVLLAQRLAAARTDLVFLYLLCSGHSTTGLPQVLSTAFADVMDTYIELAEEEAARNAGGERDVATTPAATPRFRSFLFDEEPVTMAHLDRPALRLRVPQLLKLLARVYRNVVNASGSIPSSAKAVPHAATLLTLTLQTHGLMCSGGVPSPGWSPTPDTGVREAGNAESASTITASAGSPPTGTALLDKFPKLSIEQLIQHLGYLVHTTASSDTSAGSQEVYLCPPRSRGFGLTGVEALLMSATQPEQINQIIPLYVRGHTLPDPVAEEIVRTRNVHEALRKTQQVVGRVVEQAERELAALAASTSKSSGASAMLRVRDTTGDAAVPHPALAHLPSHFFVRGMGSHGPPPGWAYHGVHLGIKAEAMNVRYSLNASDTATLRVIDSSGLNQQDVLFVWAAKSGDGDGDTGRWVPVSCRTALVDNNSSSGATPSTSAAAGAAAPSPASTLRVVTWNSQFNRHSGKETPLGRAGIDWCTPTRHVAAAHVLAAAEADVICLQEVEADWMAYLCAQPWVREQYAVTALENSPAVNPHGVVMLVRRGLCTATHVRHVGICGLPGQTSTMPEVTLQVGPSVAPIVIGGLHLLAPYSQNNETMRLNQLQWLEKHVQGRAWHISTPSTEKSASPEVSETEAKSPFAAAAAAAAGTADEDRKASHIILGDFNDYPTKAYRLPPTLGYKDAWEQLNPTCQRPTATPEERGYTIDGAASPYTAKIIEPKFFGRPDRVLYSSRQLQPISAELVGTSRVTAVLPGGEHTQHMQVDKPTEPIPDYLYPSDHFGVLVEFQIV